MNELCGKYLKPLFIFFCCFCFFIQFLIQWPSYSSSLILFFGCALLCIFFGYKLWFLKNLKILGGLFSIVSISLISLCLFVDYAFIDYRLLYVQLAIIILSLMMLYFVKCAFLTLPLFMAFYPLMMNSLWISYGNKWAPIIFAAKIPILFGICMILIAYLIDRRTKEDYAFWLYFVGLYFFNIGWITYQGLMIEFITQMDYFLHFLVFIFFIIVSVWLERKIFMFYGIFGVLVYLLKLFFYFLKFDLGFEYGNTLFVVLVIIFFAIYYQKKQEKIDKVIKILIPKFLLKYQPKNRLQIK